MTLMEERKFLKTRDSMHVWAEGVGKCKCGVYISNEVQWRAHADIHGGQKEEGIPWPTTSQFSPEALGITQGRKNDADKLRYDLIPPGPLARLAEVYTIGAKKYDDRNWEKGIKWGRIFGAMMRHSWKWFFGERYDKTDGQHHLASVVWGAFALMEYEKTCPELDDRPCSNFSPEYLGGIFDGEGSVGLYDRDRPGYKELRVTITNTFKTLLDRIQEAFGGRVVTKSRINSLGKKPCFEWVASNKTALNFLQEVHPYLTIKAEKVATLLSEKYNFDGEE
jgi:hypothetical protein